MDTPAPQPDTAPAEPDAGAGSVQVSKQYITAIKALAKHAPSASQVLWTLIEEMNQQNALMVSVDSLALLTSLSKSSVKRALALLREQEWIEVLKLGTANVYRVNAAVAWQQRSEGKWASFDTRVLLNWSEQDEVTKAAKPNARTHHIPLVEKADNLQQE